MIADGCLALGALSGHLRAAARVIPWTTAAHTRSSGCNMSTPGMAPEPPKGWKGSGRGGMPIPGEIPGGPKPIIWKGMVLNSKVR